MRRAARIDSTAQDLVTLARQMGALVLILNGAIDVLIYTRRGALLAVDFKGLKTRKTKTQQELEASGFPLHFVSTREHLMQLIAPPERRVKGEQ
jgi:hypothetical protein